MCRDWRMQYGGFTHPHSYVTNLAWITAERRSNCSRLPMQPKPRHCCDVSAGASRRANQRPAVTLREACRECNHMCGICGIYEYRAGEPVREETLRAMLYTIRHRGPDGEGIYLERDL